MSSVFERAKCTPLARLVSKVVFGALDWVLGGIELLQFFGLCPGRLEDAASNPKSQTGDVVGDVKTLEAGSSEG